MKLIRSTVLEEERGVYTDMDWWTKIRLEVLRGEKSKREILRREGIHWKTLKKILEHSEPPGYRIEKPRRKPKIGPYLEQIAQIIEDDKNFPKNQRHTAVRIYHRIKEMGYQGKYTQVKEAVREIRRLKQEVYMPLKHQPGEAQVDFGYALAKVSGELRKVAFFVMVLPYSDVFFVMVFERECTESYWEGHVRAFEFFCGVPQSISYDNCKVLVSKIIGPHERKLTDGFLKLQSHYLFREHFYSALSMITCLLWLTSNYHPFSTGTVSLFPIIVFFGVKFLDANDFRGLSWDVLYMLGGGLCLGVGLKASGLTAAIVNIIPADPEIGFILFAILATIMTTFMSNTATANLIIPIAVSLGGNVSSLAVTIALMCSTAMALPVSTPPNAIAFGSGILRSRDMILPGLMITSFALIVVLLLAPAYWELVGLFE